MQLPDGAQLSGARLEDVDGLGALDLVVMRRFAERRELAFHLRASDTARFDLEPSLRLELTPDVVAFAIADVHADTGREVVLFNARGVFVWRPHASAADAFGRLFEADFLWQVPDEQSAFAWPAGVADLDGDGLDDLFVPEPNGYAVAFQSRAGDAGVFESVQRLSLPSSSEGALYAGQDPDELSGAGRGRVSISIGDEGVGPRAGPLLSVTETVSAPQLVDWDGDGDLDVVAQTARSVLVWIQEPRATFCEAPTRVLPNPVERDLGRLLDVTYSAHAVELDGDGRCDCVIFARDERSDDVRTQVLVFLQSEDDGAFAPFGPRGVPEGMFVLAGFVAEPHFTDIDGDGALDVYTSVVRPDLIDAVRAAASERIDVELVAFVNRGGRFQRRPDLVYEFSLSVNAEEHLLRFFADVTGDGVRDLLLRRDGGALEVVPTVVGRKGWSVGGDPVFELVIGDDAEVVLRGGTASDAEFLVLEGDEVLCVSFR